MTRLRPPGTWEGLLRRLLPGGPGTEALLGDLDEEFAGRAARDPRRARRWYRREARRVALAYLRDLLEPRPAAGPGRRRRRSILDGLLQDLRFALRTSLRNPGTAVLIVGTLALGIGANTALFGVVRTVLLRPLTYGEPGRIVDLWASNEATGDPRWGVSLHDFEDWVERQRVFEELAAYTARTGNLRAAGEPRHVGYALVTPGFFRVMGVSPVRGRGFGSEENLPGAAGVAVIDDGLWRAELGGDPGVVGRTVLLDGVPLTVVGVMPPGFDFPAGTRIWKPFGMRPDDAGTRGSYWVRAVARLAPGVDVATARADLDRIMGELDAEYPATNENRGGFVESHHEATVRPVRPALLLVWAATCIVLVIACVNAANLLLVRATARQEEIVMRVALGATRGRIVGQLLTESVLLSLVGGGLGVLLAWQGQRLLRLLDTGSIPRLDELALDLPLVGFAAALATATGLLFGLAPALSVARGRVVSAARPSADARPARGGLRTVLVVVELALAVVVLVGASLLLRSFVAVLDQSPGFEPDGVLTLRVEPPMRVDPTEHDGVASFLAAFEAERDAVVAYYEDVLERLRAVPGVTAAAAVNRLPLSGSWWTTAFRVDGMPPPGRGEEPLALTRVVTPGYFEAMGMELLGGRTFARNDADGVRPVVVVNRALLSRLPEGTDPVGLRITIDDDPDSLPGRWMEVVGVVADARHASLDVEARPIVYTLASYARFGYFGDWGMDLVVRTSGDPVGLVEEIRTATLAADPDLPPFDMQTMGQRLADRLADRRLLLTLVALLAGVALVLATVGVYGVVSHSASRRTREVGVRMAVGAGRRSIVRLMMADGARLAALGVGTGLLVAAAGSDLLAGLLFGVTPLDPPTFVAVALLLAGVTLLAAVVPAWRMTRVSPTVALRSD